MDPDQPTNQVLHAEMDALRAEVTGLRAEVARLQNQVQRAADAPAVALDRALGDHSLLGLRWLGTLLFVLFAPVHLLLRLLRSLLAPPRRRTRWDHFYAAGFAWVYLASAEKSRLRRLWRFPTAYLDSLDHLERS